MYPHPRPDNPPESMSPGLVTSSSSPFTARFYSPIDAEARAAAAAASAEAVLRGNLQQSSQTGRTLPVPNSTAATRTPQVLLDSLNNSFGASPLAFSTAPMAYPQDLGSLARSPFSPPGGGMGGMPLGLGQGLGRNGYFDDIALPSVPLPTTMGMGAPLRRSVLNQDYLPSLAATNLRYRSAPFASAVVGEPPQGRYPPVMDPYELGVQDERNRLLRMVAQDAPAGHPAFEPPRSAPATSTLRETKEPLSGTKRARDDDNEEETDRPSPDRRRTTYRLPAYQEGPLQHWSEREILSMEGEDDEQWLSEYLCFVRKDLLEVFQASSTDIVDRANKKSLGYRQVGIRCRFCAHKPYKKRVRRSSCFPSTLDRVYQSLSMMLRDHLGQCEEMPEDLKKRFLELKNKNSTGATYSKSYWKHGAMPPGIINTPQGLRVDERFVAHLAAQRAMA